MAATDDDTIRGLVRAISDPVFIVIPGATMSDDDFVKLFQSIESLLMKIEEKTEVEFDVMVESAVYFGGYSDMADMVMEQKAEAEAEVEFQNEKEDDLTKEEAGEDSDQATD